MSARRPRRYAALSIPAALAVLVGAGVPIAATPRDSADAMAETGKGNLASRTAIEEVVSIGCGSGDRSCAAEIYAVPNQHRLEVSEVSCRFTIRAPGQVEDGALLFSKTAKGRFDPVVPVSLGESGRARTYEFHSEALVVGRAGAKLVVGVNTDNDVSDMTCRFAGELIGIN